MKIKDKLVKEMEFYFGKDIKRIEHAHKVLEFAEKILKMENDKSVNELVVVASAILHDIGIHACERKYNSTAGHLQEKEGPPIAHHIMGKIGISIDIINEVYAIIGNHHSPVEINTLNFKILYDADMCVNLKDEYNIENKNKLKRLINKIFFTEAGKSLAKGIYKVV